MTLAGKMPKYQGSVLSKLKFSAKSTKYMAQPQCTVTLI